MKRVPHIVLLLLAVSLMAADGKKKEKSDFERIQGKWFIVEYHTKGEKQDSYTEDITFTLSGKKLTLKDVNGDNSDIELRPDSKPKEMDTTDSDGKVTLAIYELSGLTLKLCVGLDDVRPKKMGTGKDDNRVMLVLKRVKPDKKKEGDKK
jgi:uncharacterized protein (TIGR03067 family)